MAFLVVERCLQNLRFKILPLCRNLKCRCQGCCSSLKSVGQKRRVISADTSCFDERSCACRLRESHGPDHHRGRLGEHHRGRSLRPRAVQLEAGHGPGQGHSQQPPRLGGRGQKNQDPGQCPNLTKDMCGQVYVACAYSFARTNTNHSVNTTLTHNPQDESFLKIYPGTYSCHSCALRNSHIFPQTCFIVPTSSRITWCKVALRARHSSTISGDLTWI